MKRKIAIASLLLVATSAFVGVAHSQTTDSAAMPMGAPDMTPGDVRKVDRDAKKITLKHGEIRNLEMPGMTMVFQVKDPAMLDAVKPGDKVMFTAEKAGGALVVTEIRPAK